MFTTRAYSTRGIPLIGGGERPAGAQSMSATVLCANLHGYDALIERLTPPQAAERLGEFFALLTGAVLEFGGHVFHLAEADMLAGFGVGDARHAGIHEAMGAARAIQRRFLALQASWHTQHSIDTAVGLGIHRGEVALGLFGPPEQSAFTLVGDAVHLARQLCRRARAGEILMPASVYFAHRAAARSAPAAAPFVHLPNLALPGRRQALDVWCAPAPAPGRTRRPRASPPIKPH